MLCGFKLNTYLLHFFLKTLLEVFVENLLEDFLVRKQEEEEVEKEERREKVANYFNIKRKINSKTNKKRKSHKSRLNFAF